MPSYDYRCKAETCQHTWESFASINDPAETTCPKCKQETAQRLISSNSSFILAGGGWSNDNYSGSSNHK